MGKNLELYADLIAQKVDAEFNRNPEKKQQMKQRILSQNEKYGYNTIPDEEWFGCGNQIVIMVHDRSMRRPPSESQRQYPHNHDFFEMNYVYRGTFFNTIENETIKQDENTVILHSQHAKHICRLDKPTSIVYNILLKRSLVEEVLLRILSEKDKVFHFFMDSLYNIQKGQPYMLFECDDSLAAIIAEIIIESIDQKPYYTNIITAKLIELFSRLSRIHYAESRENSGWDEQICTRMISYMKKNYSTISISEMSRQFNYSSSFISQTLKKKLGRNYSEMIQEIRLEYACHYLTHSDLPVSQVSELVGYRDIPHFYKIFKQMYQMTPRIYREKNRVVLM